MQRESVTPFFLGLICLILLLAVMRYADGLFGPMVAAVVLGIVCAPLTDRVERLGVPRIGAALLVLAVFVVVSLALLVLIEPTITKAIRNGPLIWRELTEALESVRQALAGLQDLQESVEEALTEGEGSDKDEDGAVPFPGVLDALSYAPSIAAGLMVFIGTLYFFLVARTDIYQRIDRMALRLTYRDLCAAEARVSRYFLTITLINTCFGVLVGAVMTALGMPNPVLWGLAAALVNFVLYLGPAVFAVALLIGGLVAFDGAQSFFPPVIYLAMNATEGQFVTPSLVGKHMKVNPFLVFVSLAFWLWMWGPIGGVVAIPILVWALFIAEHLNPPEPKAEFITTDAAKKA